MPVQCNVLGTVTSDQWHIQICPEHTKITPEKNVVNVKIEVCSYRAVPGGTTELTRGTLRGPERVQCSTVLKPTITFWAHHYIGIKLKLRLQ